MDIDNSAISDHLEAGRPGTHACHFYETAEDLAQCVVPFVLSGIRRNERCLWVVDEPLNVVAAHAALAVELPRLDECLASGQLDIIATAQWYRHGDGVDAERVIAGWLEKEAEALAAGYTGLCITGNTFWLETPAEFSSFAVYERRLHQALAGRRITCLCSYCLARCSGTAVLDVVRNHDYAIVRRQGEWEFIESASGKEVKAQLAERLASKETLLNEIHHRVKNNLQIVGSLLMLKTPTFTEPAARQAVEDTLNRIHAMGLIHGMLYREDSGHGSIDFGEYLRALTEHLVFAYGEAERIGLHLDDSTPPGEALEPLGLAVPLGIAAAEAITNALKHAFPHGRPGRIAVTMLREQGDLCISIIDDGQGIDPQALAQQKAGAGLSLIRGLLAQAGGQLVVDRQPRGGTAVEFRLTLASPAR